MGDGDYLPAVAFMRQQLGLEGVVEVLGALPREDVRQEMQSADVLLHAAVSEGFCNAVIEAQSMELPVVCTDADGLRENVADGETGFVVPRRDPDALAAKLEVLARDPALRQRMGKAGRKRVLENFQLSDQLDRLEDFYRQVLNGVRADSGREEGAEPPPRAREVGCEDMSAEVTLVWIGAGAPPPWRAGRTVKADATPASVAACVAGELPGSTAEAWLFWSSDLGSPDPERVDQALATPGDLWHAGLRLGMGGLPRAINHVEPTWMLNRDPDPSIVSTSWRVSLDACLVRTDVLRRVGIIHPEFRTLAGAALEFGHRCIRFGVLTRHMGSLAGEKTSRPAPSIPIEDELRFVYYRFGRRWLHWTVFRTLVLGWAPRGAVLAASKEITRRPPPPEPRPYRQALEDAPEGVSAGREADVTGSVTILIPTVDRYPYLEKLLDQLRRQTVPPLEIVIVDQTPRRSAPIRSRVPVPGFADPASSSSTAPASARPATPASPRPAENSCSFWTTTTRSRRI